MKPHRPRGHVFPFPRLIGLWQSPQRKRGRPREPLWLEPLEDRTLLSVSISGTIFNDLNPNGSHDSNEPALVAAPVFLDMNGDGQPGTYGLQVPAGTGTGP